MRLYKEQDGKISIYDYLPDEKKVQEYKEQELAKIKKELQVLRATTNSLKKVLEQNDTTISLRELFQSTQGFILKKEESLGEIPGLGVGALYHKLERSYLSKDEIDKLIEDYISGKYETDLRAHRIRNTYDTFASVEKQAFNTTYEAILTGDNKEIAHSIEYLLSPQKYDFSSVSFTNYIDGIINIPQSLYIYHLLKEGDLHITQQLDTTEQLKLFTPPEEPIATFDIATIEELDKQIAIEGYETKSTNYQKLKWKVDNSRRALYMMKDNK